MAGVKRSAIAPTARPARQKDWMTSGEVARALNMTDATIRRWAREGLIEAMKTPGGQYRIRRESLAALTQSVQRPNGSQRRRSSRRTGRRS